MRARRGSIIYRNAVRVPPAAVFPAADPIGAIVASADLGTIEQLPSLRLPALAAVEGGWAGEAPAPGTVVVSTEFGPDWELESSEAAVVGPREAFGWSTAFDAPAGSVRVRFTEQWVRTVETLVLGLLWLAALWITRKPVSR